MENIDNFINRLQSGGILSEGEVRLLCIKVKEFLIEDSNIKHISAPVTLCGDIHGQFHDLLDLIRAAGPVETTKYIFMGDFVDRGYYSVETFTLLMALKVKYPN